MRLHRRRVEGPVVVSVVVVVVARILLGGEDTSRGRLSNTGATCRSIITSTSAAAILVVQVRVVRCAWYLVVVWILVVSGGVLRVVVVL